MKPKDAGTLLVILCVGVAAGGCNLFLSDFSVRDGKDTADAPEEADLSDGIGEEAVDAPWDRLDARDEEGGIVEEVTDAPVEFVEDAVEVEVPVEEMMEHIEEIVEVVADEAATEPEPEAEVEPEPDMPDMVADEEAVELVVDPDASDMIEEEEPSLTAGFVLVSAGSFTMGSPGVEPARGTDETQHPVTLTINFEMMAKEVTQGDFRALMIRNPSYFPSCGNNCPVEQVSWHEALDYANALSRSKGAAECFDCANPGLAAVTCLLKGSYAKPQDCPGYRLPTEAEWEYAARAGTTDAFYSGPITNTGLTPLDPNLDVIGWYGGNSTATYTGAYDCSGWFTGSATCGTQPVGGKQANLWGLFDMSGNVWEWVWDWYGAYPGDVTDYWGSAGGSGRVYRGGGWVSYAPVCRSAERGLYSSGYRTYYLGFRLARSL